jgi:hypothetical protein
VSKRRELEATIRLADHVGHGERTAWVTVRGECLKLQLPEAPRVGLTFQWRGGPWRLVRLVEDIWTAEPISQ